MPKSSVAKRSSAMELVKVSFRSETMREGSVNPEWTSDMKMVRIMIIIRAAGTPLPATSLMMIPSLVSDTGKKS